MSVVQGFNEVTPVATVAEWAHANPSLPRVIGIDVGQDKLTVWFGAPNPHHRSDTLRDARFHYFAWVLVRCSATRTNAEARVLVLRGLEAYRDSVFALASDVVIEKQHKLNGRMKSLAKAIGDWVRREVPNGGKMRIVEREARHKFASLPGLPCPMPQRYEARKQATLVHIGAQVRHVGERWHRFLNTWIEAGDDLADAACIAQDWMVSKYPLTLFSTARLAAVQATLATRRRNNTWRNTRRGKPATQHIANDESDDDGDDLEEDSPDDQQDTDNGYQRDEKRKYATQQTLGPQPLGPALDDYVDVIGHNDLDAALLACRTLQ